MRRVFALFLALNLSGCSVLSYLEIAGAGAKQDDRRCFPGVFRSLSIKTGEKVSIDMETDYGEDGGIEIRAQYVFSRPNPKVRLMSARATLSAPPGYALIDEVHATGGNANYYKRAAGDAREEVLLRGTSILDLDIAEPGTFMIKYKAAGFSGSSTQLTLPSLMVDGKRVDIAPVTLTKRTKMVGLCYVPS